MTDANLNTPVVHQERHSTIQQAQLSRLFSPMQPCQAPPTLYPWLRLPGRWLQNAGFVPGQRVKVEVQHRKLVITIA